MVCATASYRKLLPRDARHGRAQPCGQEMLTPSLSLPKPLALSLNHPQPEFVFRSFQRLDTEAVFPSALFDLFGRLGTIPQKLLQPEFRRFQLLRWATAIVPRL